MRVLLGEAGHRGVADEVESLRRLAIAVDHCRNMGAVLERVGVHDYDVLVIGQELLGWEFLCAKASVLSPGSRLLLVTGPGVRDRIQGLELGADDCLARPYAFAELLARIRALARRSSPALPPVLEHGGLVLDLPRHRALRDGTPLLLSPKEFAVLEVLLRAQGGVVSTEELLEKAWDEHADPFTNAVRMAVMTLRRKLGQPNVIRTVPRAGYQLV
ncbi:MULTISPECIES: response regulator transcription factor [unclassified Crossiella]|uniref:response regulator transcription factor n=1 Tax=unclassified Crossiella TaxID=2620835 RepID=UPI001FFE7970|nr:MULTISPECIES: response regulator transcription factor [unclassified Crossiella]MCK2245484.1 response regulator transcription factor [Crossiella sp. S99.2]MCK2259136.1 response regulator transcription factor [Crossiella sp. S99.1]